MFVWECLVIITPIQIRAYTGRGKFSETSWSQPISTDPDNTAILVGITVPIVLLVIILLAFVILRKLQCGGCHKTAAHHITRGGPPVDSVNDELLSIFIFNPLNFRSVFLTR